MKCNISATIDSELVERARKEAVQQRRSLSNLLERALERALAEVGSVGGVVTSGGRFVGRCSRWDGYGER